jgi:CRISP-associated protein Cas1
MVVHIMSLGASLRVKDGLFEVINPQLPDGKTYVRHEYAISHVESFWVHSSASVTTAALRLAIEHDIDFVLCDHFGMPLGRFMPHRPSTTAMVQKSQLWISQSPHAITYVKEWVGQKLNNQVKFLTELAEKRKSESKKLLKAAASKIEESSLRLMALEGKHISEIADILRGIEGAACRVYFEALNASLSQYYNFKGRSRQPAQDLFNAFLNYGYAMLYNRVEKAVTMAGLSPFVGFLHRDDYGGTRSFIFDSIEPYRIEIDKLVYRLFSRKIASVQQHGTTPPNSENGMWLSEGGKKLISAHFIESFDRWQVHLSAAMRHSAATMRKHLNNHTNEETTDILLELPHVFN